jgi:hypothetical protein
MHSNRVGLETRNARILDLIWRASTSALELDSGLVFGSNLDFLMNLPSGPRGRCLPCLQPRRIERFDFDQ